MTRDEFPVEIKSLIGQCEVGVTSFTNDQMSAALHWGETLARLLPDDACHICGYPSMHTERCDKCSCAPTTREIYERLAAFAKSDCGERRWMQAVCLICDYERGERSAEWRGRAERVMESCNATT